MIDKGKHLLSTAIAATFGVGLLFVIAKYRRNILNKIKIICDIKNPLRHQHIEVINTAEECKAVVAKLKSHSAEYCVLGFDCEWVTARGGRRPVALLQLASHKGLCALIRLCNIKRIPPELKEILEDENILKVGVAPIDDSRYLCQDYGVVVAGTFDLRHFAKYADCKPEGLAKMSSNLLGVTLDKNWRIRCSDWEARTLSQTQQEYAARDALVAIEIFKQLVKKIDKASFWQRKSSFKDAVDLCQLYTDAKFKLSSSYNPNPTGDGVQRNPDKLLTNGKKFKPYSRNFSTRRAPLYNNCYLQAPDGEVLCTCGRRKAEWYIEKLLGNLVCEDPYTVRLKFEPSGRAVGEVGQYYIQEKINQCVVCGKKDSYIRKNVVPREYRKLFPDIMKEHTSHDVLLLCTACHQRSNLGDLVMRQKLAVQCGAPMGAEESSRLLESPDLKQLRSATRALLHNSDTIPQYRIDELRKIVLKWYPDETEVTTDMLKNANDMETTFPNESYEPHGRKVVEYYTTVQSSGGLTSLERLWREHFLNTMCPKYLPNLWSVTHNANRLEIRASQGRIEPEDLILAGLESSIPPKTTL